MALSPVSLSLKSERSPAMGKLIRYGLSAKPNVKNVRCLGRTARARRTLAALVALLALPADRRAARTGHATVVLMSDYDLGGLPTATFGHCATAPGSKPGLAMERLTRSPPERDMIREWESRPSLPDAGGAGVVKARQRPKRSSSTIRAPSRRIRLFNSPRKAG